VSTIMRSSPRVNQLSEDAIVITAKAAELFLAHLALSANEKRKDPQSLEYTDIADIVQNKSEFSFLQDVIPKKITVREYRQLISGLQTEGAEKSSDKCEQEPSSEEES